MLFQANRLKQPRGRYLTPGLLSLGLTSVLTLGLTLASPQLQAEQPSGIHPYLSSSFIINVEGFSARHNNEAQYGFGNKIDFEADLDTDNDKLIPAANLIWRISDTSQLQFEYFGWSESSTKTITKDIEWGDISYPIGASINASEDFDIYRLFYGYNFSTSDNHQIGAGVGLHYADFQLALDDTSIGADAPVPNIGVYGSYAFSEKWLVNGRIDWLSLDIDEYSGSFSNISAAIQYQAFDNVGFGMIYRYLSFNIEKDNDINDWEIETSFDGPSLFMNVNF